MGSEDTLQEGNQRTASLQAPPYSVFSQGEKILIIVILATIGFWSAVSSPIYFPALPTLSRDFKVSEQVVNLSVVAYLVFQGIAPTLLSNVADTFGRRPVYVASFLVYIAACIGLARTNVFWLMAVLRCVQAAGIAPVIAINAGVAGDLTEMHERGGFVSVVNGFLLVGNGFGGLIGASLIQGFDWRAIFIFLAIGSGVTMIAMICLLPETCRLLVGNGSVRPKPLYVAPLILLPHFRKKLTNDSSTLTTASRMDVLTPFRILVQLPVLCAVLPSGIQFASWTMALTSISTVLESDGYNYSVMHVGLIYLPQGVACFIGSIITGRILDSYYRYRRDAYDKKYADVVPVHRPKFNNLRVRLDVCLPPAVTLVAGLIIFGWCLQKKTLIVAIIISSCLISFSSTAFMSAATTMLVDLYPTKGSTSMSCMNLLRCLLAALGVGVYQKMVDAMGLGGCYTLLAGLCFLANAGLVYFVFCITTRDETPCTSLASSPLCDGDDSSS